MTGEQDLSKSRSHDSVTERLLKVSLWLALVIGSIWFLSVGRSFLIPFVLALLAFYLTLVLNSLWQRIPKVGSKINDGLSTVISGIIIIAVMLGVSSLIARSAAQIAKQAPAYQERLTETKDNLVKKLPDRLQKYEEEFDLFNYNNIDVGIVITRVAGELTAQIGNVFLITIYVFFLLLERKFFDTKLGKLIRRKREREEMQNILEQINKDIRAYFGVKTFTSSMTGLISYLIMRFVGLDFAEFWALLIFLFNYIPNIGSLIATSLPTLLALVQFDTPREFLIVGLGVGATQMIIGNVIEPRMTGKTLNMSPLVVIVSLVLWGKLWGITGMFLCVPITAIVMIILSQFPGAKWVVVCLSQNGEVKSLNNNSAES